MFTKESLLAALKAEVKEVEIKALGGAKVRIQVMTGAARDEFYKLVQDAKGEAAHFESALVSATVVDESGARMFSADDVVALKNSSAPAVSELASAAMAANGMGAAAQEAAGNV